MKNYIQMKQGEKRRKCEEEMQKKGEIKNKEEEIKTITDFTSIISYDELFSAMIGKNILIK